MWYRIVGTSHIARHSAQKIRQEYKEFAPDVIAIELDQTRLQSVLQQEKPNYSPALIAHIGVRGYLFALIGGLVQRRLAKIVNVLPGIDMRTAALLAKKEQKRLILIDQDVRLTLQKLNRALGWQEMKQFFKDLFDGLFRRRRLSFRLDRVPKEEFVVELLKLFKQSYPRPYNVLVHQRNKYMVAALRKYHELYPVERVLVVVGAGHQAGMEKLLQQSLQ